MRKRALDLMLAASALFMLGTAAILTPAGDAVAFRGKPLGIVCFSRRVFGVECPFCGMTRSFVALMHGDVKASFEHHWGGPLLALTLLGALVYVLVAALRRRPPLTETRGPLIALQAVAGLCVVLGIVRLWS
jgi:hypothetical protein